jgi:hypothetical protein
MPFQRAFCEREPAFCALRAGISGAVMARLFGERQGEYRLVRGALRHRYGQDADREGAAYEERITLWQAASFDEAIERAGIEAAQYASILGGASATDLMQAYQLSDGPSHGAEVYTSSS